MSTAESPTVPSSFDDDVLLLSTGVRDRILERYPALADVALRRLFAHLLGSTYRDDDTGRVVVPSRVLQSLRTGSPQTRPPYTGIVRRFRADVFDFVLTSESEGRCRCLESHACPASLLRRVRSSAFEAGVVSFVTGEPPNPVPRNTPVRPESAEALAYLESVPLEAYAPMVGRLGSIVRDPDLGDHDRRVLAQIARDPRSRYSAVERSLRLFPHHGAMLLTREARKRLLAPYGSLDLRQAQLAIVSRLWDLPTLRSRLDDPKWSVWRYLARTLRRDLQLSKPALKAAVYTVLFGGGNKRIRDGLSRAGFTRTETSRFLADPLIAELIDRRDRALESLVRGEPVRDAYGNELSVTEGGKRERQAQARSALACQVQSFEFRVMDEAVVRYCSETDGLDIVGMLHDGAYFRAESVPAMRRHLRAMESRVAETSDALLGVRLRVETDPGERRGRTAGVTERPSILPHQTNANDAGGNDAKAANCVAQGL
ncbi:MAG: hypothetical protein KIS66_02270 [Fimbriimonadaceae bacterium]|nr:hypothetical protein [Fimbriimonadaceae bacterium]